MSMQYAVKGQALNIIFRFDRSNRNIVVQALKELLESSNKTPSSHGNNGESNGSNGKTGEEDLARLEKDVQRVLLKRKRAESRASSVDSGGSGGKPPGSPFQVSTQYVQKEMCQGCT